LFNYISLFEIASMTRNRAW